MVDIVNIIAHECRLDKVFFLVIGKMVFPVAQFHMMIALFGQADVENMEAHVLIVQQLFDLLDGGVDEQHFPATAPNENGFIDALLRLFFLKILSTLLIDLRGNV